MDWYHVMLDEHLNIVILINALKAYARKIESGEKVPDWALSEMIELIRNFADRCHHGKEEMVLFPILDSEGEKEKALVKELLSEHEKGRNLVKGIASGNKEEVIKNSRDYVALLIMHIAKENKFFKECDSRLNEKEKEFLFEEFEKIEDEAIGKGNHEKYIERVHKVSEAVLKPERGN